jgi:capsular exopolysaccharide synthesis family protein
VSPKPLPNGALGALVGLGLAIALIVFFEWIDDRPSSPEEIQELLGVEILISLPRLSRKQHTKQIEEIPALAEGCRKLCASLNVAQRNNPFKLVMITSALAGEGKSSIASDLAAFLAMMGKRTLLVDANLQSSVLDRHFDLKTPTELTSGVVVTWPEIEDHLNGQPTTIPNLFIVTAGVLDLRVLTAGAPASASTDLLQSSWVDQLFEHFKKAPFDYVIFDTPPLLAVAETQILASYVHTAVLVVDASKTPRQPLRQTKRALNKTHTRVLGVVLNKSLWPSQSDSDTGGRYRNRARPYLTSSILSPEIPLSSDGHESANGSGDPNMTVTLPRRRNPENEKM